MNAGGARLSLQARVSSDDLSSDDVMKRTALQGEMPPWQT
jgi:hypothetical protein